MCKIEGELTLFTSDRCQLKVHTCNVQLAVNLPQVKTFNDFSTGLLVINIPNGKIEP